MSHSFSIKSAFAFGWEQLKEHTSLLLGSVLTIAVLSIFFDYIEDSLISVTALVLLLTVQMIIQTILEMGFIRIALNIHDKREANYPQLFGEARLFLQFFAAGILSAIVVGVGLLLFIVPGIIAAVGLFLVSYIVVEKELGAIDALKESWRLTKGHKWRVFLFSIVLALFNIVGMLAFIIGLLITIPISFLATIYVYKWLDKQDTPVVQRAPTQDNA